MVTFNPADPTFLANPYPFFAMGRGLSPLQMGPQGFWSVFGYEDCAAILRDHATWASGPVQTDGTTAEPRPTMLGSNPPVHSRLRGLVSQAFTPRMVEQLAPRIEAIAEELLDAVAGQREVDFIDALAHPLPVIVIAEILGVPAEDRAAFRRWSDVVVSTLGGGVGGSTPVDAEPAVAEMGAYFTRMVEARRQQPQQDLLTGLVAAEHEGSRLSFDELLAMLVLLLVAGNETTTNLIGNAAIELIAHPAELLRLRTDPALLPSALEEVLRFSSPVQATVRRATSDTVVAGKTIPAGDAAITWLAAANRDPSVFPDPDRFDITRTPNRHLGFGQGIHFCLGAPLARLEAKLAFDVFLRRVKDFERLDDTPLPRVPTFIMRGVRSLPLRVTPA